MNLRSTFFLFGLFSALCACAGTDSIEQRWGTGGSTGDGYTGVGGQGGLISSDVASSSSGHSTTTTTTSSGSGAGSTTSTTTSGSGGSTICTDPGPGEPNDTESDAYSLGSITDKDPTSDYTQDGVLAGDDTDWYVYDGQDTIYGEVDPTIDIKGDATVEVCQFFECATGNDPLLMNGGCPQGTSLESTPSGHPGCCGQSAFTVALSCSTTGLGDDSATVYLRLRKQPAVECVHYTLSYHF